jgi:hypothetical protein
MASLLSVQGYADGLAVKNPVEFRRIAGWFGRGR